MSKITTTNPTWATMPLRLALGASTFVHGAQKVLGVWGGKGFGNLIEGSAPFGLRPSWIWLAFFGLSEFVGGIMIIVGLYTRLAALLIAITLTVSFFNYYFDKGFFLVNGGYEYILALIAMALALIGLGGGNASVDVKIDR